MKSNIIIFVVAVALAFTMSSFYEAKLVADTSMDYFYAAEPQSIPADWQGLVKYLLSFATGLVAVFLRALIKRIWPNFEFDEKSAKHK